MYGDDNCNVNNNNSDQFSSSDDENARADCHEGSNCSNIQVSRLGSNNDFLCGLDVAHSDRANTTNNNNNGGHSSGIADAEDIDGCETHTQDIQKDLTITQVGSLMPKLNNTQKKAKGQTENWREPKNTQMDLSASFEAGDGHMDWKCDSDESSDDDDHFPYVLSAGDITPTVIDLNDMFSDFSLKADDTQVKTEEEEELNTNDMSNRGISLGELSTTSSSKRKSDTLPRTNVFENQKRRRKSKKGQNIET